MKINMINSFERVRSDISEVKESIERLKRI